MLLLSSAVVLHAVWLTQAAGQQLNNASDVAPASLVTAEMLSQMPSITLRHDGANWL